MKKYLYMFEHNEKQIYLNTINNTIIEYKKETVYNNNYSLGTTFTISGFVAVILVLFKKYHITFFYNSLIYIFCIMLGIVASHVINRNRQSKMCEIPITHFTNEQWKSMALDIEQSIDNSVTSLIVLTTTFIPIIIWSFFKNSLILSLSCGIIILIYMVYLLNFNYIYLRKLKHYVDNL